MAMRPMEADSGSHTDDDLSSAGDVFPAAHPGPFHWAYDMVQALLELATAPMLRRSLLMTGQSVSTNFSGVGAVGQAVTFINAAASHHLGHTASPRFARACESDCANQALLRRCFEDNSESGWCWFGSPSLGQRDRSSWFTRASMDLSRRC